MGRVAGLSADETRERLLNAAADVFAKHGFDGARTAQIAKAAGVSAGALYNHFESKAELLAAVIERRSANDLMDLLATEQPEGLLDLIVARGKTLETGRDPLLAEVILAARRDPEALKLLRRKMRSHEALMADVVRLAQSSGEVVDDVDPAVVARFFLMVGLGSLLVAAIDVPPANRQGWASFITRLVDGFRAGEDI